MNINEAKDKTLVFLREIICKQNEYFPELSKQLVSDGFFNEKEEDDIELEKLISNVKKKLPQENIFSYKVKI